MNCIACLFYEVTADGTTQVAGTVYCGQHGQEALAFGPRGPRDVGLFSDPRPPTEPSEPSQATTEQPA